MLKPSFTRQFQRDLKRMQKRGKDIQKFKQIAEVLLNEKVLEPRFGLHLRS